VSISINYHREGAGPPLVLLHGVGHHWQAWRPVIDLLAGEFDVIACDSPGFGRSAPLPAGIEPTIASYVDAFEWFFAELGLERPHVAGNSMGGTIALELARRRAIRTASAFSPAGFWTAAELRFCQLSLGGDLWRLPARRMRPRTATSCPRSPWPAHPAAPARNRGRTACPHAAPAPRGRAPHARREGRFAHAQRRLIDDTAVLLTGHAVVIGVQRPL
jgi:pimeloyl-ACP methyl ester carboxylesterase